VCALETSSKHGPLWVAVPWGGGEFYNNNINKSTPMMASYSLNGYVVIYDTHVNDFHISLSLTKNSYITHFTSIV